MRNKNKKGRFITVISLFSVLFLIFASRLFYLQIIKGSEYKKAAHSKVFRETNIKAPRGQILDRYGRPLVTNRMGFSAILDKSLIKKDELNNTIINIIDIFKTTGDAYLSSFPMTKSPYKIVFSGEDAKKQETDFKKFLKDNKLNDDITAEKLIEKLKRDYEVEVSDENLEFEIIKVRYEMELRGFSKTTPYTFAKDIDKKTVTYIEENRYKIPGAYIEVEPIREYTDPTLAPHILGRVGPLFKEEYNVLKNEGYKLDDVIGKDGVEKSMEQYLKGTDGKRGYERDMYGNVSSIVTTKDPIPGNNIVLTIDKDVQRVAQESLKNTIKNIQENSSKGSVEAAGGAAVAIEIETGDIIALASAPDYNLETFTASYEMLSKDPNKPLLNKALTGLYEPGSTYKMVTSLSGLENNIINPTSTFLCNGVFTKYKDYHPRCWIYNEQGGTHGPQNVTDAIKNSCNLFYYNVGDTLGIDKLNKTAKSLGLGERTGIELSGESKGQIAGPELRKKRGELWRPGDTLQAAIGQSENLFTPIQFANYVATLIGGGTLHKVTLIESINSYNDGKPMIDTSPKVISQKKIAYNHLDAIKKGMLAVTSVGGTAHSPFIGSPVQIAGKTGTASVSKGAPNGVFVAFAPYDNPKIAVAVIVEHGNSGGNVAPVVRDIIEAYMKNQTQLTNSTGETDLIY